MRARLPPANNFTDITLPELPGYVLEEYVDSGRSGHVFRAFSRGTGNSLAVKMVPVWNRKIDVERINEAQLANQIVHQSVVRYVQMFSYFDRRSGTECMVYVCEYIRGENIKRFVKHRRDDINVPFVEGFLRTMFELLYELKTRRMVHGDLHAGNVIVSSGEFDVYGRPSFRVTDFRVRPVAGPVAELRDFHCVAETLGLLMSAVQYTECEGRDRFAFNVLRDEFLSRHLTETNPMVDELVGEPRGLLQKLESIDDRYQRAVERPATTLASPFDYPNCEQIGDSNLLLRSLYSDRLLGLAEIGRRSNLVLTGPRGCGKTTVYRALSLDYLIATEDDNPNDVSYVGLYYRCDDLYFSFSRYRNPTREDAVDIPMHFVVVTLIAIALERVFAWGARHFRDETKKKESGLVIDLCRLFGWNVPEAPGATSITSLLTRLQGERRRAAKNQRLLHLRRGVIEGYVGPGVLFEACRMIRARLQFLHNRPFYFFIDDYSHPKITRDLQANLNRLVMHRTDDLFFKLSTESPISFAREDIDGKRYVESREYDLVNLGLRYIGNPPAQTLGFLQDLFARRFQGVPDYPVRTLDELLGSKARNESEIARTFRNKQGRHPYSGIEAIACMCSGDIHYMIRLVGNMIEDCGGKPVLERNADAPRIPIFEQHRSIRRAAGAFLESVRTLPKLGQRMADIISALGNVAHSYLLYRDSHNVTGHPPHQATRIEPYGPINISQHASEILDELLRYSIFIEDPRAKSRRGVAVRRFYLRRYLIPHFQLTFSLRDSLQLENNEIELMLMEPRSFEDTKRLRSRRSASTEGPRDGQSDLFSDA